MQFEDIVDWYQSFHIIRPINTADPSGASRVKDLHNMLSYNGFQVIPLKELLLRNRTNGLVMCDCGTYLHYAWCQHVMAIAYKRGIITSFQVGALDPSVHTKKQIGQTKKAQKGGALDFD